MKYLFRRLPTSILITFTILSACALIGCGQDEEPTSFVSATPTVGSTIEADTQITVTFDAIPLGVNVTVGEFIVDNTTVTITGPFSPGDLYVIITWEGGTKTLTYTVAGADGDNNEN